MQKIQRTIWRTRGSQKELLSLEPGRIRVCVYEVERQELQDLIAAAQDCLAQLDDTDPPTKIIPIPA